MPSEADLLTAASNRLGRVETLQIQFVRRTLEPGPVDQAMRWCQRVVGASWIHHCTKHLRHVHGLERLPPLDPEQSFICVSNHRSFFDQYVITGHLVHSGLLPHRIVFPVRANFFYDRPAGLLVNGVMSFFAMYPPIFRERKKLPINVASLGELVRLLQRGGTFAGLHPEGTRKKDDDPYTLLPAQRGVGRVIHESKVTVLPVFINGLVNDLPRQVRSNFDGTGRPIHVVFGKPVDFGDLLQRPSSPQLHRAVAARTLEVIGQLGQEEKLIRQSRVTATD